MSFYSDFLKESSKSVSKKADAPKKQESSKSKSIREDVIDWDDL